MSEQELKQYMENMLQQADAKSSALIQVLYDGMLAENARNINTIFNALKSITVNGESKEVV